MFELTGLLDPLLKGRKDHPGWAVLRGRRYAHRGYHDKPAIPENSLPAFRRALERGWGAEFDVHIIKDGTLVVFHDSELKRCAGVDGIIEDLDLAELRKLRLEGTDELIPTFDEVLALFSGKAPLIIELKTYKGNHLRLAEAVCKRLDSYEGPYCIESFDPRAVADVRKLRPDTIRGQLSQDFTNSNEGLPGYQRIILTSLLMNCLARPDFIAYKFEDRGNRANRRCITRLGLQPVSWTIRSLSDLKTAEAEGCIPIFERFDPEA